MAIVEQAYRFARLTTAVSATPRQGWRTLHIHPNARTTPVVRAEIARSAEPSSVLARRHGVSTETVRKSRKPPGPSGASSGGALLACTEAATRDALARARVPAISGLQLPQPREGRDPKWVADGRGLSIPPGKRLGRLPPRTDRSQRRSG